MSEQIIFRNAKMETGQLIIDIPPEHRGNVMKFLRTKKDKAYSITIKEYHKKRSLDANAYAWVLIHKLAEAMKTEPEEVYLMNIPRVGYNFTPMCVLEQDVERLNLEPGLKQ